MLEEITSRQLTEWMAFFSLEPFGYDANLAGHAVTSTVIANVNRRKGARPFKPQDFLPKEREVRQGDFVTELKQYLKGMQSDDHLPRITRKARN